MTENQALSQLAERLGKIDDRMPLSVRDLEDIDSAKRIISELAKVGSYRDCNGFEYPLSVSSANAVEKSRQIAAE